MFLLIHYECLLNTDVIKQKGCLHNFYYLYRRMIQFLLYRCIINYQSSILYFVTNSIVNSLLSMIFVRPLVFIRNLLLLFLGNLFFIIVFSLKRVFMRTMGWKPIIQRKLYTYLFVLLKRFYILVILALFFKWVFALVFTNTLIYCRVDNLREKLLTSIIRIFFVELIKVKKSMALLSVLSTT